MNKDPENLYECIEILEKMLKPNEICALKSGEVTSFMLHPTFGRTLRNNLNLWGESKLKEWFKGMGIFHPDDMSGIIFDSFICHLRGEPIELEKQIEYYQKYWAMADIVQKDKSKTMTIKEVNGKWEISEAK